MIKHEIAVLQMAKEVNLLDPGRNIALMLNVPFGIINAANRSSTAPDQSGPR